MTGVTPLDRARMIADEVGVEWRDLGGFSPPVQVSKIQDRVARHVFALKMELLGIEDKRQQRIAA